MIEIKAAKQPSPSLSSIVNSHLEIRLTGRDHPPLLSTGKNCVCTERKKSFGKRIRAEFSVARLSRSICSRPRLGQFPSVRTDPMWSADCMITALDRAESVGRIHNGKEV